MEELQYPIGKYTEETFSETLLAERIRQLSDLPKALEYAIINLDAAQLKVPYRPGGWNSMQVVHHVADSHMNAYIRFKLALTEDVPVIKTYDENAWSQLPDITSVPVNYSITLLHALHTRLVSLLEQMKPEDWDRKLFHPEKQKEISLWYLLGLYAWHGRHHTAHINKLRESEGWH